MSEGTVLVVGSSGGMGSAVVERLHGKGYTLIGADKNAPAQPKLLQSFHQVDLTVPEEVLSLCQAVKQEAKSLWGLVYGAAMYPDKPFMEYPLALYQKVAAVNVTACFLCIQQLAPLIERGGRIVTIISGGGLTGSLDVGYASFKAAQIGMSRSAARNLADRDIRVNMVSPGATDTPMLRSIAGANAAHFMHGGLLKRLGKPEEIAVGVDFLLQRDNTYMTGAIVDINGGINMR